jgi:hypothetical protein
MTIRILLSLYILCCLGCENSNEKNDPSGSQLTKANSVTKDSTTASGPVKTNGIELRPKSDSVRDFTDYTDPGLFFFNLAEAVFTNSSFPLRIVSLVMQFTEDSTATAKKIPLPK